MDITQCSSLIFNTCFESNQYKYSIFLPVIMFTVFVAISLFLSAQKPQNSLDKRKGNNQKIVWSVAISFSSLVSMVPLILFAEPLNFIIAIGVFLYVAFFMRSILLKKAFSIEKLNHLLSRDLRKMNSSRVVASSVRIEQMKNNDSFEDNHVSFFEEFIMNKATLFFLCLLVFTIGLIVFR